MSFSSTFADLLVAKLLGTLFKPLMIAKIGNPKAWNLKRCFGDTV